MISCIGSQFGKCLLIIRFAKGRGSPKWVMLSVSKKPQTMVVINLLSNCV